MTQRESVDDEASFDEIVNFNSRPPPRGDVHNTETAVAPLPTSFLDSMKSGGAAFRSSNDPFADVFGATEAPTRPRTMALAPLSRNSALIEDEGLEETHLRPVMGAISDRDMADIFVEVEAIGFADLPLLAPSGPETFELAVQTLPWIGVGDAVSPSPSAFGAHTEGEVDDDRRWRVLEVVAISLMSVVAVALASSLLWVVINSPLR